MESCEKKKKKKKKKKKCCCAYILCLRCRNSAGLGFEDLEVALSAGLLVLFDK